MSCDRHQVASSLLIGILIKLWIAICICYVVSLYIFLYRATNELWHSGIQTLIKTRKLNVQMSLKPQIIQNVLQIHISVKIIYGVHLIFPIIQGKSWFSMDLLRCDGSVFEGRIFRILCSATHKQTITYENANKLYLKLKPNTSALIWWLL